MVLTSTADICNIIKIEVFADVVDLHQTEIALPKRL